MTGPVAEGEKTAVLYPTNVHCADCVRDMINGTLRNQEGVVDATYDTASGALSVRYRPEVIAEEAIRATISDLGYGFAEAGPEAPKKSAISNAVVVMAVVAVLVLLVVLLRSL